MSPWLCPPPPPPTAYILVLSWPHTASAPGPMITTLTANPSGARSVPGTVLSTAGINSHNSPNTSRKQVLGSSPFLTARKPRLREVTTPAPAHTVNGRTRRGARRARNHSANTTYSQAPCLSSIPSLPSWQLTSCFPDG